MCVPCWKRASLVQRRKAFLHFVVSMSGFLRLGLFRREMLNEWHDANGLLVDGHAWPWLAS